jgi:DNA-binding transcriptional MerR regulator
MNTLYQEADMYGNWNRDNSTDKPEGIFSITSLARTCGVSRATILRMENEGLLEPAYIDPANSYRYYDCKSVAEVIRILNYQRLGFTKKEIADLYEDPLRIRESIAELRDHHEFILRELEELSLKINETNDIQIRETEMPEGHYYVKYSRIIYGPEHVRRLALNGLNEFISANMRGTGERIMMLHVADESEMIGSFDHREHECRLLIPTMSNFDDDNVIYSDPYKALTLVCRGNYYKSDHLFSMLWDEALKRGLKPVGPINITGLPEVVFDSIPGGDSNMIRILLKVENK